MTSATSDVRTSTSAIRGIADDTTESSSPRWGTAVALGLYVVCAFAFYGSANPASTSRLPGNGTGDVSSIVWYVDWVYVALAHGLNPLYSSAANYPHGINLMDNTSAPLLGLLVSPITAIAGPVAGLNVLLRLSLFVSAGAMYLLLRRWTTRRLAAFFGGLVYGFGPYMAAQGYSHPFLTFAPFPPLVALLGDEILVRQRWRPWRTGAILGVLGGLQVLVSLEVFTITALAAVVVFGIVLLVYRQVHERARLTYVAKAIAASGLAFVAVAGYPLWVYVFGPYHLVGVPHSVKSLRPYHANVMSAIVPTANQLIAPASAVARGDRYVSGAAGELGVYIGLPLAIALVAIVWRHRHLALVQLSALIGLGAFILTLGMTLTIGGHDTGITLPFRLLTRVPLLQGIEADRFAVLTSAATAVIVAIGLDRLKRPGARRRHRNLGIALVCVGVIVVLAPLIPRGDLEHPIWLDSSYFGHQVANRIPAGSVALLYPNPDGPYGVPFLPEAMLWQAQSGMRFKQIGYYGADSSPASDPTAAWLQPTAMQRLLDWGLYGTVVGVSRPPLDAATLTAIRDFLARYEVKTVVVVPVARWKIVVADLTAALGRRPESSNGVLVWYDIGESVPASTSR